MKRRIDVMQLNELTGEQKIKLRGWWNPQKYDVVWEEGELKDGVHNDIYTCVIHGLNCTLTQDGNFVDDGTLFYIESDFYIEVYKKDCLPVLDIGQMFELLESIDNEVTIITTSNQSKGKYEVWLKETGICYIGTGNLCNALWEAVKGVL